MTTWSWVLRRKWGPGLGRRGGTPGHAPLTPAPRGNPLPVWQPSCNRASINHHLHTPAQHTRTQTHTRTPTSTHIHPHIHPHIHAHMRTPDHLKCGMRASRGSGGGAPGVGGGPCDLVNSTLRTHCLPTPTPTHTHPAPCSDLLRVRHHVPQRLRTGAPDCVGKWPHAEAALCPTNTPIDNTETPFRTFVHCTCAHSLNSGTHGPQGEGGKRREDFVCLPTCASAAFCLFVFSPAGASVCRRQMGTLR